MITDRALLKKKTHTVIPYLNYVGVCTLFLIKILILILLYASCCRKKGTTAQQLKCIEK